MSILSLEALIAAVKGEAVGIADAGAARVMTDSRKVQPGDLFWALHGSQQDGHSFVDEALQQGAIAAVVSREWARQQTTDSVPARGPWIAVADTLQALQTAAAWKRQVSEALMIGVTGSVGKTTTRHLIHTVLSSRFRGVESPENFNNHVGVPLSLLQLEPRHEFAVLEAGASRCGEISRLAKLIQPEIGVITAIAPAHLEEFESIENICRAKGELLEALPRSGFAVVNGDDQNARKLAQRASCRVILVGERVTNDVVARGIEVRDGLISFQCGDTEFELPAVGRHHLNSALIAIAIAREIGLDEEEIFAGMRSFLPVHGRCEPLAIGDWTVIDDTYNANPGSMQAACRTLRDWQQANQRVLVAGDMLALGERTEEFHKQLGATAKVCGVDRLLAVGSQAALVARTARDTGMDAGCLGACRDFDTALMLLDCWLQPGDVVLVKGSRGMRMERVIDALRQLAADRATPIETPSRQAA